MDDLTQAEKEIILFLAGHIADEHSNKPFNIPSYYLHRDRLAEEFKRLGLPHDATVELLKSLGLIATEFHGTTWYKPDHPSSSFWDAYVKILGGVVPLARRLRSDVFPLEAGDQVRPPEAKMPTLTPLDVDILQRLTDGVARVQYDLVDLGDRKLIGNRLKRLRKIGYVEHPDGGNRRNAITPAGRERLDTLSQTSPKNHP